MESPSSPWGGIASAVRLMCEADVLTGRRSTVLAPGRYTGGAPNLGTPERIYGAVDRVAEGALLSRELLNGLKGAGGRSGIDVVVHNEELRDLLVELRSDSRNRVVYYSHGLSSQEHPGQNELDRLQRDVLATGVTVLVASEQQRRELLLLRPKGPVRAIPPPLALHVARAAAPRPPPEAPLTLVAAGRTVPQKGFDLLLRAVDACSDAVGALDLYAGHGAASYEGFCRELAAKCRVSVRWRGWVPQEELIRLLPLYSALIMPSRFEPLGLLAAEAIGAGLPVAGSDTGGLGDLIRASGGVLIPCSPEGPSPAGISSAIRRLPGLVAVPPERALRGWSTQQYSDALAGALEHEGAGG